MTTIARETVKCGCCGSKSDQTIINSTNEFGSADLDTRPPEMRRSTINSWIQRCPTCDYCFTEIAEFKPAYRSIISSDEYIEQLIDFNYPDLANSFLCKAIIDREYHDYAEATWSLIHAAWVCDDAYKPVQAKLCRGKAADMFIIAEQEGQEIMEGDLEWVILIDLLRRGGQWEKARNVLAEHHDDKNDFTFRLLMKYESMLLNRYDDHCHTFAGAWGETIAEGNFLIELEKKVPKDEKESDITDHLKRLDMGDTNLCIKSLKKLGLLKHRSMRYSRALKSDDERVRVLAAWAIGRSKNLKQLPDLIDALNDECDHVRYSVVQAIGKFKNKKSTETIIALLKDGDSGVRYTAIRSLAIDLCMNDISLYKERAENDDKIHVRNCAMLALGKLKDPSAIPFLIGEMRKQKIEELEAIYYSDLQMNNPEMYASEMKRLYRTDAQDCEIDGGELYWIYLSNELDNIDYGGHDSNKLFGTPYSILAAYGSTIMQPMLELFETKEDVLRGEALKLIGQIDDERVIDIVLAAIDDEDQEVQSIAINMIRNFNNPRAIGRLLQLLDEFNEYGAKRYVLPALLNIGQPVITPLLNIVLALKRNNKKSIPEHYAYRANDDEDVPM